MLRFKWVAICLFVRSVWVLSAGLATKWHEMWGNMCGFGYLPLRCDKARAGKGDQPHCHVLETHARATKTLQSSGLRSREAEKTRDRGLGGEARQVKKWESSLRIPQSRKADFTWLLSPAGILNSVKIEKFQCALCELQQCCILCEASASGNWIVASFKPFHNCDVFQQLLKVLAWISIQNCQAKLTQTLL